MAANAGSIEYDVIADTSGLLKAEKAVDSSTNAMIQDFGKVDKAAKSTGTQITKTSKAVKTGMASMGRGAGQAGIQLQQFIGQIQGGQNAMLALSQQSADLGFVLGAPLLGAVVGISASIVGLLLPSLLGTDLQVASLTESLDKLKDKFDELSQSQQNVVRAGLETKLQKQSEEYAKLAKEVNELQTALMQAERASAAGVPSFLGADPKKANQELVTAKVALTALRGEMDLTQQEIANLGGESEEFVKSVKDVNLGLEAQIIALRDGEEAALRYSVAQQLGLAVGEQIPDNINAQIDAIFRLKDAQDAEAESIKNKAAAQRKADAESKALSGQVQGVASGLLTPTEQLQAQLMERQTILQAAHEQELIAEQEFLELKRRANEQYVEGLKAIDEQALGNQKNQLDKLGVSWDAFGAQAAGAMTGVITGATDADDALQSMAMTILNQLVGALITMGIQAVIGQTTAAATGAATAGVLATAYAPAAAMASLASFGANAAPAAAGIASTVALSQGLALSGGRQFGGGVNANSAYRFGEAGPEIFQTQSGKNIMLPGENGKVLSNSDSMDAMGGGDVSVIVENYGAPASATITQDFSEGQRKVIVKMIGQETSRQISENTGPIAKSLKSSTSTTMKANR